MTHQFVSCWELELTEQTPLPVFVFDMSVDVILSRRRILALVALVVFDFHMDYFVMTSQITGLSGFIFALLTF